MLDDVTGNRSSDFSSLPVVGSVACFVVSGILFYTAYSQDASINTAKTLLGGTAFLTASFYLLLLGIYLKKSN
jgi:hypothetical protein